MSDEFLTVSELGNYVRDILKSGFPRAVWVCGEIQELREKSNHLYFTLSEKDKNSNQVVAKIGVSLWATMRPRIDAILKKAENAFQLKEDIEVKLLCKVDFYPPFGQIRLIVEGIDPIYTLGKIAQDRQRLIAALKQKGVLDQNKQVELPRVALNVGLITSYESAAYHDFIDELKRSGFGFNVFIVDAVMQGKNAESSVLAAMKVLNGMANIDVMVITRGGGSVTDLSCFDSEKIAMAIAASALPVLSGIGHEINTTVTDLAAHTFAKTPTAVAQLLIGRVQAFLDHLNEREEQVLELSRRAIERQRSHLKDGALTLQKSTLELLKLQHQRMARVSEGLKRASGTFTKGSKRRIMDCQSDLKKTIHLHLQKSRDKIEQCQKLVGMADPKNILKRGFSITRSQGGKVIGSLKDAAGQKSITTQLLDGFIISDVKEVRK